MAILSQLGPPNNYVYVYDKKQAEKQTKVLWHKLKQIKWDMNHDD